MASTKELSEPPDVTSAVADTDPVQVHWRDGSGKTMHEITYGQIRARPSRKSQAVNSSCHWEGMHTTTNFRIRLRKRTDRNVLMSMFEGNNQVCSVHVGVFGDEFSEEALQKSFLMMKPLAVRFANNQVSKDELYAERDRILASMGLTPNWKVAAGHSGAAIANDTGAGNEGEEEEGDPHADASEDLSDIPDATPTAPAKVLKRPAAAHPGGTSKKACAAMATATAPSATRARRLGAPSEAGSPSPHTAGGSSPQPVVGAAATDAAAIQVHVAGGSIVPIATAQQATGRQNLFSIPAISDDIVDLWAALP